jgi:hypothetical protein
MGQAGVEDDEYDGAFYAEHNGRLGWQGPMQLAFWAFT